MANVRVEGYTIFIDDEIIGSVEPVRDGRLTVYEMSLGGCPIIDIMEQLGIEEFFGAKGSKIEALRREIEEVLPQEHSKKMLLECIREEVKEHEDDLEHAKKYLKAWESL